MTLQREMETGVGEFCIRELFRIKIKLRKYESSEESGMRVETGFIGV